MKFIYPEFLWALLALAIPIIIHLFNFRRFKKIAFSNVKFLRDVKQATRAKSKLKHWLVLLSRLLAVAFLVFAFAQPFVPVDQKQEAVGQKAISVYLDNSFSMEGVSSEGALFELAKKQAEELVTAFDPSDLFQLLTNDFEGKHQRLLNREDFLEQLTELNLSPVSRKLEEVMSRQKDILLSSQAPVKRAFVISDFQSSFIGDKELAEDSTILYNFVPLQAEQIDNVYIDTVWFSNPIRQREQNEGLSIRIVNSSPKNLENVPLKLSINGVQKSLGSFSIAPNGSTDTTLFFTNDDSGFMEGMVSLEDYPITYDDKFYLSYSISKNLKILVIQGAIADASIEQVFKEDELFVLEKMPFRSIDYSHFTDQNLIVLQNLQSVTSGMASELKKFVEKGGSVCIFPGSNLEVSGYNEFLLSMNANTIESEVKNEMKVSSISSKHPLYENVFERIPRNIDLPVTQSHITFTRRTQTREERLLSMQDGTSFLSYYPLKKGGLYLWNTSTDKDQSNLTQHAIFVTSLLRIAEFSQSKDRLYYTIGKDEIIDEIFTVPSGDELFHITQGQSDFDVIPQFRNVGGEAIINLNNQLSLAGNYLLKLQDKTVAAWSFNYSRAESVLNFYTSDELKSKLQAMGLQNFQVLESSVLSNGIQVASLSDGEKYWKYCVILSLLFLLIEIVLLRFWKS